MWLDDAKKQLDDPYAAWGSTEVIMVIIFIISVSSAMIGFLHFFLP